MGERIETFFEPTFNHSIKVQAGDDRLTSDAGAILLRQADHELELIASLASRLHDPRQQHLVRYLMSELLRERIYTMALGYRAQDDVDRLAHDPALRMSTWDRAGDQVLDERSASQPTQSRLIDTLAHVPGNMEVVRGAMSEWVERHLRTQSDHAVRRGTIDIDSFPIEIFGDQAGAAYNGYYHQKMYHPLVASFSVAGDYDSGRSGWRLGNGFIHATLRRGNAHTAEGCLRFLDHVLELAPHLAYVFDLRMDAGFMIGRVLDYLARRKVRFIGRLKSNPVLDRLAEPHLKRPRGRPPQKGYERVVELGQYQAEPWEYPQRLLLVVIDEPDPKTGQLELEPDYFFMLSGWAESDLDGDGCLAHYRQRGTFEDRLGEFNQALGTQLSSPEFRENEATFLLSLLAFNLSNMLRNELEDSLGSCWDLSRFRDYVLKAGARITKHARRLITHLAPAVVEFWKDLIDRIQDWHLVERFPRARGPTPRAWRPPPRHAHQVEVLRG